MVLIKKSFYSVEETMMGTAGNSKCKFAVSDSDSELCDIWCAVTFFTDTIVRLLVRRILFPSNFWNYAVVDLINLMASFSVELSRDYHISGEARPQVDSFDCKLALGLLQTVFSEDIHGAQYARFYHLVRHYCKNQMHTSGKHVENDTARWFSKYCKLECDCGQLTTSDYRKLAAFVRDYWKW